MRRSKLLSLANCHGSVDVRGVLPSGCVHVSGKRLQPLCRKLWIKFATALIGFEARGRKAKYGWIPQFDGVVVSSRSAPKLLLAIEERNQRAASRPPVTDEMKQVRRERRQQKDEQRLLAAIIGLFPSIPRDEAEIVARHTCQIGSGRVGRTTTIEIEEVARRAVVAHVRHMYTDYDKLLDEQCCDGMDYEDRQDAKEFARSEIAGDVARILSQWKSSQAEVEGHLRKEEAMN